MKIQINDFDYVRRSKRQRGNLSGSEADNCRVQAGRQGVLNA